MIDDEFDALMRQEPDRSLEGLEGAIWVGVARQEVAKNTSRLVTRCQAMALILTLFGSAAAGAATAASAHVQPARITLTGSSLNPSTLLLGRTP